MIPSDVIIIDFTDCDMICWIYDSDVNVEHMQLLLFLFHGLPLMQKKCLLLQKIGQTVVEVAEALDKGFVLLLSTL